MRARGETGGGGAQSPRPAPVPDALAVKRRTVHGDCVYLLFLTTRPLCASHLLPYADEGTAACTNARGKLAVRDAPSAGRPGAPPGLHVLPYLDFNLLKDND